MNYDSHCHLDLMDNMTSMIQSIRRKNIGILAVGTTPRAYLQDVKFCNGVEKIHVALGMHPQLIGSEYADLQLFESLVHDCHYIGEIGLDFSMNYINTKISQIEVFTKIISWCELLDQKVISIHALKSASTLLEILSRYKKHNENIYIMHWFTGTSAQLSKAVEFGCYFSINPKMLKTKSGIECIRKIPLDRILLETDAPFSMNFSDIDNLNSTLQNLIKNISIIKGIEINHQLISNERNVFRYL